MKCRLCSAPLEQVFLDLVAAPLSNAFLTRDQCQRPEPYFPLKLFTCTGCWLVQVDQHERPEAIFSPDYIYFSSYSKSWLDHAKCFVDLAVERLALGSRSAVVEVASNDGYLLQYMNARDIRCIGIEPTASTAAAARERGIETVEMFLGHASAQRFVSRFGAADLVIGNNVLAHVPDLNDFIAGLATLMAPSGALSLEFPHLLQMVTNSQFDTVYHEHFSYLSLHTAVRALQSNGLTAWDVEQLPTHGGSLRLWARHAAFGATPGAAVQALLDIERGAGMLELPFYLGFQQRTDCVKNEFAEFLIDQKKAGRVVAAYGAAAKGNTLLNYAGVKPDLLSFVADASPHKQGRFLPGSRIPVVTEQRLRDARPDFVVILPWNLRDEITEQLSYVREWGGRFVTAIPDLRVD
jgi:SAM-dependent methyltransferase